uniref:PROP1-like PPR domain-containing protein n=1 Tax=Tetradesmus obliquus TaxID=3088 RepID=A0A383VR28_TETOB
MILGKFRAPSGQHAGLDARRNAAHRPRTSRQHIARVAQGNSDTAAAADIQDAAAAAAPLVNGVSPLQAVLPSDPNVGISHAAVGAKAAAIASGARPYNGNPPPGVSDVGHLQFSAGRDAGSSSSNGSHSSSSSSSSSRDSTSSGRSGTSATPSSSSSSSEPSWQPPKYRQEGIRLRSKRDIQAAQRGRGQNLVVEDLKQLLASNRNSFRGGPGPAKGGLQEDHDTHLEGVIEQLLCPTRNVWELSQQAAPPAADSSDVLPQDVLQGIGSLPADKLAQLQAHLARAGQFTASLLLIEEAAAAGRADVLEKVSHKIFLQAAGAARNMRAVLRFLQLLPAECADARTYNMAIKACSTAKDLHGALKVMDMMAIRQVPCDFIHFTTLITVCAAAGDVSQAFAVFAKAKAAQQQLAAAAAAAGNAADVPKFDSHFYGALIAACAQGIKTRSSDRKDQLVILDRAYQVLQEAMDAGVHLETPVWNALLMCAGRCRQLQRCFEVLDLMTGAGVPSDPITFTCLIEAAVLAGETEMAQRVFARAMAAGVTSSVQLYTAAINACMANDGTNFEAAFEIYAAMQRNGVEPDDLLYGHLIALAGRCRKLEVAFDLIEDMRASGLKPSTPTCSALMYACLQNNNFAAARKVYDTLIARGVPPHISQYNALMERPVYDTLIARGVPPHISQYNALMEQYALRYQLGNVVSLLTAMVGGGIAPNANTFRILLLTCQRTDQAELAFELYQVMKARGLQPRLNNAHSICYTLLKACYNRIRRGWRPGGYPPKAEPAGPYSSLGASGLRPAEARQLLHVLEPAVAAAAAAAGAAGAAAAGAGSAAGGRQAQQGQHARRYSFVDNAENINWPLLALSTYRDFISWGYKPHLEVLDKLLACLRLQPPRQQQQPSADVQRSQQLQAQLQPLLPGQAQAMLQEQCAVDDDPCNQQQAILRELANPGERRGLGGGLGGGLGLAGGAGGSGEAGLQERPYEVPFDKRAMDAVLDAINMGLLPSMKLDVPLTVDMRCFPPMVAEAYVHVLMQTLEARGQAAAGGSDSARQRIVAQPVRLVVPPFDHNYVMWPSYVAKLFVHYNEQLLERQAQLRAEAEAARWRAAALAARRFNGDDSDDEDMPDDQLSLSFGAGSVTNNVTNGDQGAGSSVRQQLQQQLQQRAMQQQQRQRSGYQAGGSWESLDSLDEATAEQYNSASASAAAGPPGTATLAAGRYLAGAITGLAVAATFRRLKAYVRVDAAAGALKLEPREINRWLGAKLGYEEERRRLAREAEMAAAGYSSTTSYSSTAAYYQQHVYVQPQQGAPWMKQGRQQQQQQFWQQQQQQQQGAEQPQQQAAGAAEAAAAPAAQQDQQQHTGSDAAPAAAAAAAGRPRSAAFKGKPGSRSNPAEQLLGLSGPPGHFGVPGRGRPALDQQARNIRLGLGSTAAAAAGAAAGQQQQAAGDSSSSGGSTSSSGRVRRTRSSAPPAAAAAAAAAEQAAAGDASAAGVKEQ